MAGGDHGARTSGGPRAARPELDFALTFGWGMTGPRRRAPVTACATDRSGARRNGVRTLPAARPRNPPPAVGSHLDRAEPAVDAAAGRRSAVPLAAARSAGGPVGAGR